MPKDQTKPKVSEWERCIKVIRGAIDYYENEKESKVLYREGNLNGLNIALQAIKKTQRKPMTNNNEGEE